MATYKQRVLLLLDNGAMEVSYNLAPDGRDRYRRFTFHYLYGVHEMSRGCLFRF